MAITQQLSSTVPDPFEVYNELVRRSRRSSLVSLLLVLVSVLAMGLAFLSFARPLPVVVVSDNPLEPRRIVAAGDTSVRELDAKRFLVQNAARLHGWTSANVVSEMTTASLVMTSKWRKRFTAELNASVAVPKELAPAGQSSVLESYVLARIRNELVIDWDSVACSRDAQTSTAPARPGAAHDGVWHCKAQAAMNIQKLEGDPVTRGVLTRVVSIRASLVEVLVTESTVDGLLIDFWDAQSAGGPRLKDESGQAAKPEEP